MDAVFSVAGKIKGPDGAPIAKLIVALVDEDEFDEDDLLGFGTTDDTGGFKLSFVRSEFQQDAFETEETPDLKIIASLLAGEAPRAIFARSFPEVDWSGGRVDLGDIAIENFDLNNPVYLEGVPALPGADKRATKIKIDDAMVAACFAEVLPLVKHYTGWSGLGEGITIEVVDSLAPIMLRELFKDQGTAPDSWKAKITEMFMDSCAGFGAGAGLYDPSSHTIYLNRSCLEQNGIETLKVILGHELVHSGEFLVTPGLQDYGLDYQRRMLGLVADPDPDALKKRRIYMVELEGYATYIERDFLRKIHYPFAASDYHSSATDLLIQIVAALASLTGDEAPAETPSHGPPPEASMDDKLLQYEEGVALYRSRATADQPARWAVQVADLPH